MKNLTDTTTEKPASELLHRLRASASADASVPAKGTRRTKPQNVDFA